MALRPVARLAKVADVDFREERRQLPEISGQKISQHLSLKGFCVIDPGAAAEGLESALEDIAAIDAAGQFSQPPAELLEGLLGSAGSSGIAEVGGPGMFAINGASLEGLRHFDAQMTDVSMLALPYLPRLDVEVASRTVGLLHEAGVPMTDPPPLTEALCSKWLTTFTRHKLMCVVSLGPDEGTLELQPFDEDCNGQSITMKPGTFVILRPDALSHRFSSGGRSYCLSCFFLRPEHDSKHQAVDKADYTPCASALLEWAMSKIRTFKESEPEEQARTLLPRHWEFYMNHTSFVGQNIAVRSAAIRQSSTWQQAEWVSAFTAGPDHIREVPFGRFNIDDHYNPHPEGWNYGAVYVRHGAFIEGVTLFDSAIFRISKAEAGGMDPGHRLILESGYEALVREGYKGSSLINSRGGVYVASPPPQEWGYADKSCATGGVCGGGGSVAAGRISFTHGMKGPCISLDVEGASSLVAVDFCCTNLSRIGRWDPIPYGLCTGWNLILHHRSFILGCASGQLAPTGRTFCFDASGCGYVRGEGVVGLVLKSLTDVVDGNIVVNQMEKVLGCIASNAINQSGKRASMMAPDGAAQQEVMALAIRFAEISPLDVDAVDSFSDAHVMMDAVEAAATAKAYRPEDMHGLEEASPLAILAVKSSTGNQLEIMGLSQILRVCVGATWGAIHPTVHLRLQNPYMDLDLCDRQAYVGYECLEFRSASCYTGVTNRSLTGTNCQSIVWGQLTEAHHHNMPEPPPAWRDIILFWPEGGGELEDSAMPARGYHIMGSFNRWLPQPMEAEGHGVFGFTVTLGENGWERFQIALDGDRTRILHPQDPKGEKGDPVCGPEEVLRRDCWVIDGRTWFEPALTGDGYVQTQSEDAGSAGDRYRVRMRIAGKWRTVDWEKLDARAEKPLEEATYQIIGTWNDREPQEMLRDPNGIPGLYFIEVLLPDDRGGSFQIVRNRDWDQVLCPVSRFADASSGGEVLGPELGEPRSRNAWLLWGWAGDVFRIEFQRQCHCGADMKRVSWRFLRRDAAQLSPQMAQLQAARSRVFHLCGSWDDWTAASNGPMLFTGYNYVFYLMLGPSLQESFQIHEDGNPNQCYYPSVASANPDAPHDFLGPEHAARARGLSWTIGLREQDEARKGACYQIRLGLDPRGSPVFLDWVKLPSLEGVEDARGRGCFAFGR